MAKQKSNTNDNNRADMVLGANIDTKSFNYAMRFLKSSLTLLSKMVANFNIPQIKPELSGPEMAAAEVSKGPEVATEAFDEGIDSLDEYNELLKDFNENFNVTGIVGIYAFRRIARYGKLALSSMIKLTIENQKLENGFSSLEKTINSLNKQITNIKTNLGSSISVVLEPSIKLLSAGTAVVSKFTSGLSKLPTPLKEVMGIFTLLTLVLPSVISLYMVLRYYASKVTKTFLLQASAGSKLAQTLVTYRKAILSTISTVGLAVVFITALFNLLNKTSKNAAKVSGNLGLASFDDVNVLQNAESLTEDMDEATTVAEKLEKAISAVVLAISGLLIIKKVKSALFEFVGAGIDKSFNGVGVGVDETNKKLMTTTATLNDANASATKATYTIGERLTGAFNAAKPAIAGLTFGITSLISNWDEMNETGRKVSLTLEILAGVLTLVAVILGFFKVKAATAIGYIAGAVAVAGGIVAAVNSAKNQAKSATNITAMAHGGTVSSATVAMVGEGKYSEAVVPLGNSPEFSQMKNDITNAVLAGLAQHNNREQPINITVNVDKDYIYKSYNNVAKQYGRM